MSIFIDPKDKPAAYNGHESFAFVSYCHADFPQLQPDFRELSSRYRVWYDEGLKSGEEWLEEIAPGSTNATPLSSSCRRRRSSPVISSTKSAMPSNSPSA